LNQAYVSCGNTGPEAICNFVIPSVFEENISPENHKIVFARGGLQFSRSTPLPPTPDS